MGPKQKQNQQALAEEARKAAAKARGTGTRQGQATAKFFERVAAAHESLAK